MSVIRVLLVEDDDVDAEQIRRHLREPTMLTGDPEVGFEVTHARSISETRRVLNTTQLPFDCVVLDTRLPDSDGLRTVQRVHEMAPRVPIVVLSGVDPNASAKDLLSVGADTFLRKSVLTVRPSPDNQLQQSVVFAIERRRLLVTQRKLAEEENERSVAIRTQRDLLPRLAEVPGLEFHGVFLPLTGLSGDCYDVFPLANGGVGFIVGDVSGHGYGSAMIMTGLRRLLRSLLDESEVIATHLDHSPARRRQLMEQWGTNGDTEQRLQDVAQRLSCSVEHVRSMLTLAHVIHVVNDGIHADTPSGRYATVFLGLISFEPPSLTWVGLGHRGVLVRADGGRVVLESTGRPIGLFPSVELELEFPGTIPLQPGDVVAVLTDGFHESHGPGGVMLGEEALWRTVEEHRHRPAKEIVEALVALRRTHLHGVEAGDDATGLVLKFLGRGAPARDVH
ncbi:MAG: response regulator [Planctomycetota bacterium]|nr:MAG: response regulator [Planctomycetota bacterium]